MIIFFGSVFVDIIANVNKDFLDKYYLKPDEAVRATPEIEQIFQEIMQFNPTFQPGGSVLNSARVFHWISRKSYPFTMSGCAIGTDKYGEIIKMKLQEEDICQDWMESTEVSTGVAAVLVTGHMRTMVTYHGPSKEFLNTYLEEHLLKYVQEADYFYFSALSIRTCFDIISKVCQHFNEKNKLIAMNLGATILSTKYPQEMSYLFDNSDVVFGNENEYRALYDIDNSDVISEIIFSKLIALNPKKPSKLMVMTRANKSVYVFKNGNLNEFDLPQIQKNKIVDTNGAGDAFVGGFLAQYVKNKDISDCVRCGLWAATEIIQQQGCNFDKNKVYDF